MALVLRFVSLPVSPMPISGWYVFFLMDVFPYTARHQRTRLLPNRVSYKRVDWYGVVALPVRHLSGNQTLIVHRRWRIYTTLSQSFPWAVPVSIVLREFKKLKRKNLLGFRDPILWSIHRAITTSQDSLYRSLRIVCMSFRRAKKNRARRW